MSLRVFVCLIFSLLISGRVHSSPDTIRFVVPEFKPFTYLDNGKVTGIGVERIEGIMKYLKWPYTISHVPNYGRALAELKAGRADGFLLASENAERNEVAELSATVLMNNWSWFYLGEGNKFSSKDFRKLQRIGTILNTNTHKWLLANNYQVSYSTTDPIQLINLLKKERLDAVFLAEAVFIEAMASFNDQPEFSQHVEVAKPMGVYISKEFLEKEASFQPVFNTYIRHSQH